MNEEIGRLAERCATAEDDSARLDTAAEFARALAEAGEMRRAKDAARLTEQTAQAIGDRRSLAVARYVTGVVNLHDDDYLGALTALREALRHAQDTTDLRLRVRVLVALGHVHYRLGQQADAIDRLTPALTLAHRLGDDLLAAEVYRALAGVYSRLEDPSRAGGFARRALVLARSHGASRALAESLVLLGNVAAREQERRFYAGDPGDQAAGEEALAWYGDARPLVGRLGDRTLEYRLINNTARVMIYLDRPDEAAKLLDSYLTRGTDGLTPAQVAVLRFGVGEATLREDPHKALPVLLDAVRLAQDNRAMNHIPKMHLVIANAYEQLGDTANALIHHKAYHEVEQLIRGESTRQKAAFAAVELEAEEIRLEADQLRESSKVLSGTLQQLRDRTDRLGDQARRDPLTNLSNRRAFEEWLDWVYTEPENAPVSVALFDIDGFKSINDRYSHQAGDEVLRRVARLLEAAVRGSDLVARYGGEEFALILRATPLDEAVVVCERVRRAVADADWAALRAGLGVTVSAGVAQERDPIRAVAVADQRLYTAKDGGRNRVVSDPAGH